MLAMGTDQPAQAALRVVAVTPELASIAKSVGGDRVDVTSLARPDSDYHKVEARPSDVVQVSRADLFVRVGMDLEMWADALLNSARNPKVAKGGPGYVDCSTRIRKLEVPSGQISGASGDIHVLGNPHYWYDPGNAKVIAYEILLGLRRVDPQGYKAYDANYARFGQEIDQRLAAWTRDLAPYKGKPVVAYHAEWTYFYRRFGLVPFGYLEPKPGIPPSGSHVSSLISRMKQAGVKCVIVPSIYPLRFPEMIGRETGARLARVPYSVGSLGTKDYIGYLDLVVSSVRKALQ
jgi:zinc/manganese transport system substrate-binding protein